MYDEYKAICDRGELEPGGLWLWQGPDQSVLNFATKRHWRQPSKFEWIEVGLKKFRLEYERLGITEISFPRLGCGNGGLDWNDVRPLMERYLGDLPISVFIHDFEFDIGMPEHIEQAQRAAHGGHRALQSFASFRDVVADVLQLTGGRLVVPSSKAPYEAGLDPTTGDLVVSIEGQRSIIELDDLRTVWLAALSGLVTRDNIGAKNPEDVDYILGLLSAFPSARVVQIQRKDAPAPEEAVEFRGHGGSEDLYAVRQRTFF